MSYFVVVLLIASVSVFQELVSRLLGFFLFLITTVSTYGQTCVSQANGNWNTAATWLCNGVVRLPTCNDTIDIATGTEVTVTNQNDYTVCGGTMALDVHGTLTFTSGNKVRLPCGSLLSVQTGGVVRKSGSGGGSSTLISICGTTVWKAEDGQLDGPIAYGGDILPVELIFLKASNNEHGSLVEWSTASETNNDRFEIFTSQDGDEWKQERVVLGAGNSNRRIDY